MIYYYITRVVSAFDNEPTYAGKLTRVKNIIRLAEDDDEVTPLEMIYLNEIIESMRAICIARGENGHDARTKI